LREKLAAVLITPSLGVPNGSVIYINTAPQSVSSTLEMQVTLVGQKSPLQENPVSSERVLSKEQTTKCRVAVTLA
jgi:hypothetical protein